MGAETNINNSCLLHENEITELQQSLENLKKTTITNIEANIAGLRQSNHSINNSLQRLEGNLTLITEKLEMLPSMFKKIENIEEIWIESSEEGKIPGKFNLHQFLNQISKSNDDLNKSVEELLSKVSEENLLDSVISAIENDPQSFVTMLKKIIEKDDLLDAMIQAIKVDPDKFITAYKKINDSVLVTKASNWNIKTSSISSAIALIMTIINIILFVIFGKKLL